jgi:SAM-dependent methyltransferase
VNEPSSVLAAQPAPRPLYAAFGHRYEALFGGEVDEACLRFVESLAPAPGLLLDAGCGPGRYALEFAARGYRVVAVDREAALLKSRPKPSAVSFLLGDLRALPLRRCFQVVLARGVLNDLVDETDLIAALKSIAGVLAPEGRFVADVREREAHRERIRREPVVERSAGAVTFRSMRTIDEAGVIVSREQFSGNGASPHPFDFRMRTFRDEDVRSLWPEAGLKILAIETSYGAGSTLSDRLVIVAQVVA